jgi:hypothetical protein
MSFFGPISPPLLDEASSPLVRRALQRVRIVGNYAVVQAFVQGIGFLSGILLVRRLEQREYAYFTIANTMQATINILADIGISIGLVSIGGRVWHDRHRFGQLVVTALSLRRRMGLVAMLVVTPILYFMLAKNGASLFYISLLIIAVLGGLVVQLSVGVLGVVPRLRSDIGLIQKIDFTGSFARLAAIVVLAYFFLNAGVAVLIGSLTVLLQYFLLRRYVARTVDLHADENADDRKAMFTFIRSQAANAIFFCLQGQITVFLISFFGHKVSAIAEVGALGRLAMIFAVLGNILTNVFAPAFARCQSPRRLGWLYSGIVGGVACFSLVVIAAATFFPDAFLFVLGNKYGHLQRELVLMVAGAVLNTLTGTFWTLNAAKAWIAGSWLYIPLTLTTQVSLIPFTDFSSVRGVLLFNLISALPNLALNLALSFRGFRSLQPSRA